MLARGVHPRRRSACCRSPADQSPAETIQGRRNAGVFKPAQLADPATLTIDQSEYAMFDHSFHIVRVWNDDVTHACRFRDSPCQRVFGQIPSRQRPSAIPSRKRLLRYRCRSVAVARLSTCRSCRMPSPAARLFVPDDCPLNKTPPRAALAIAGGLPRIEITTAQGDAATSAVAAMERVMHRITQDVDLNQYTTAVLTSTIQVYF